MTMTTTNNPAPVEQCDNLALAEALDARAEEIAAAAGPKSFGVYPASHTLANYLRLAAARLRATGGEAARDPELRAAQGNYIVAQAIAKGLNKGDPDGAARDAARAREWIADQLDRGRVFEPGKVQRSDQGTMAVVEPVHEEMFGGRVRVARQLGRERDHKGRG